MNEKRKEKTAKIITEKKKPKQTQNKTKNYTNPICLI